MGSLRSSEALSGGIFLIGLGIVFLVPGLGIWPWILAVIGLAGLPAAVARKRGWFGWQGFFWLVGLTVLFATDQFWPGILILAGVSALIGGLTRGTGGSPFTGERAPDESQPFPVELDPLNTVRETQDE